MEIWGYDYLVGAYRSTSLKEILMLVKCYPRKWGWTFQKARIQETLT
jgi:hypothetical protein